VGTFEGKVLEQERSIYRSGLFDSVVRVSVNLVGGPAMSLPQIRQRLWRQKTLLGASVKVIAPTGQYDPTKLVNLGTNRWFFKPELGISQALGHLTLEFKSAVTVFTDNDDFFNGKRRAQDPLYSFQAHAIYEFPRGIWASLDATYFAGGRTTVDGTLNNDLQQNWRVGGTLAFPIDVHNSIKLYASSGVAARTGNSFDLVGIAWQHRWGGGL
jgi:hypothetical protein